VFASRAAIKSASGASCKFFPDVRNPSAPPESLVVVINDDGGAGNGCQAGHCVR
jgi:hypothetical protein